MRTVEVSSWAASNANNRGRKGNAPGERNLARLRERSVFFSSYFVFAIVIFKAERQLTSRRAGATLQNKNERGRETPS